MSPFGEDHSVIPGVDFWSPEGPGRFAQCRWHSLGASFGVKSLKKAEAGGDVSE